MNGLRVSYGPKLSMVARHATRSTTRKRSFVTVFIFGADPFIVASVCTVHGSCIYVFMYVAIVHTSGSHQNMSDPKEIHIF